jgi:hypothetical protein
METPYDAPDGRNSQTQIAERALLITRICCGAVVALDALAWYFSIPLGFLLLPTAIGALVPLVNLNSWKSRIEGLEPFLVSRRERAKGKGGKFAKFFSRPLWSGGVLVNGFADRIPLENIRAAFRLTLLIYYFGTFLAIAAFIAYVSIAIMVAIAVLLLVLWIGLKMLGGGSPGDDPNTGTPAGFSGPGTTRFREGFMGLDPHLERYDDKGNKIFEGRKREGFLGTDPHIEYTDEKGRKVFESREQEGILGLDPHAEYSDTAGNTFAEERARDGVLGLDPHTQVTDSDGHVISTTRQREGFLGFDPHVEHREE